MKFFRDSDFKWALLLIATMGLVLLVAAACVPVFSYNRWDNFEYFTPLLTEAHSQWLRGSVPFWNFHQHLGEPLLAQGQPGVFYPPYICSYILLRLFQLSPDHLTLIILLFHLPLAAVGWFKLLRFWQVRPILAFCTALSACFGSFIVLISTFWGQMVPVFTWLPWILYGATINMEKQQYSRPGLWLTIGLTASAWIGYPQTLIYTWVWIGIFIGLYAVGIKRSWTCLRGLFLPLLCALMFSALTISPMLSAYFGSPRVIAFNMDAFLFRSLHPVELLGMFTPLLNFSDGLLNSRTALAAYHGAWVIPILLMSLFFWKLKRIAISESVNNMWKLFFIFLFLAALFFLFALGSYGKIYALTHVIPVWSSFRWPFKFLIFSNMSLLMAAGLGLELWARTSSTVNLLKPAYLWITAIIFLSGVLMWLFPITQFLSGDVLTLIGGLGSLAILPLIGKARFAKVFALFIFITSIGIVAQCHTAGIKTYSEKYGSYDNQKMGLDPQYRFLPIGVGSESTRAMQALGLYHSATMNGAFSATGCTTAMIPGWYLRYLHSKVTGLLEIEDYLNLLGSNLLRAWNVRYVIAQRDDAAAAELLTNRGYVEKSQDGESVIYEDSQQALPRVYFATQVFPYEVETIYAGLVKNKTTPRDVYVENVSEETKSLPSSDVLSVDWKDGGVEIIVNSPEGGFLVLSTTFSSDWNARVDGRVANVFRTNGVVQGVWVPSNTRSVEFFYRSAGLELGGWLVLAGCLLMWLWVGKSKRRHK